MKKTFLIILSLIALFFNLYIFDLHINSKEYIEDLTKHLFYYLFLLFFTIIYILYLILSLFLIKDKKEKIKFIILISIISFTPYIQTSFYGIQSEIKHQKEQKNTTTKEVVEKYKSQFEYYNYKPTSFLNISDIRFINKQEVEIDYSIKEEKIYEYLNDTSAYAYDFDNRSQITFEKLLRTILDVHYSFRNESSNFDKITSNLYLNKSLLIQVTSTHSTLKINNKEYKFPLDDKFCIYKTVDGYFTYSCSKNNRNKQQTFSLLIEDYFEINKDNKNLYFKAFDTEKNKVEFILGKYNEEN